MGGARSCLSTEFPSLVYVPEKIRVGGCSQAQHGLDKIVSLLLKKPSLKIILFKREGHALGALDTIVIYHSMVGT